MQQARTSWFVEAIVAKPLFLIPLEPDGIPNCSAALADSAAAHSRVTNEVRHIGAVFAFRDENEVGALRRFERDVLGAYKMVGAGTSVRSRGVSQHIQQFRAMSISGSM